MSYTLCLVTASLLAAGPGPTDAIGPSPAPLVQPGTPVPQPETQPASPRLIDRIRSLFGARSSDARTQDPAAQPNYFSQSAYGRAVPQSEYRGPSSVTALRPSYTPAHPGAAEPSDLAKAGHEQDYSWITGRLARETGHWVLRYAGPNEIDRFGGRLPLAGNLDASKLQEGALVCVVGQVQTGRAMSGSAGPVYQVRQINMVEPARP